MMANTVKHNPSFFPRLSWYIVEVENNVKFMEATQLQFKHLADKVQERPPDYYKNKVLNKESSPNSSPKATRKRKNVKTTEPTKRTMITTAEVDSEVESEVESGNEMTQENMKIRENTAQLEKMRKINFNSLDRVTLEKKLIQAVKAAYENLNIPVEPECQLNVDTDKKTVRGFAICPCCKVTQTVTIRFTKPDKFGTLYIRSFDASSYKTHLLTHKAKPEQQSKNRSNEESNEILDDQAYEEVSSDSEPVNDDATNYTEVNVNETEILLLQDVLIKTVTQVYESFDINMIPEIDLEGYNEKNKKVLIACPICNNWTDVSIRTFKKKDDSEVGVQIRSYREHLLKCLATNPEEYDSLRTTPAPADMENPQNPQPSTSTSGNFIDNAEENQQPSTTKSGNVIDKPEDNPLASPSTSGNVINNPKASTSSSFNIFDSLETYCSNQEIPNLGFQSNKQRGQHSQKKTVVYKQFETQDDQKHIEWSSDEDPEEDPDRARDIQCKQEIVEKRRKTLPKPKNFENTQKYSL